MFKNLILFFALVASLNSFGQLSVSGIVSDIDSKAPIAGVEIYEAKSRKGTITKTDGSFILTFEHAIDQIHLSHIGFKSKVVSVSNQNQPIEIFLEKNDFELEEISVISDFARERYNPIAFTNIGSEKIALHLGDKPLPEIMNFTPGVYASRDGGGSGDATLSIRGFQQENIAVLLNGIPINGAENGLVYWNNWMGLTEVAAGIQVQRGIGASKVALNSVGGTINILTMFPLQQSGGIISQQLTNYGNRKTTLTYHSGTDDKGWALSFLGSRSQGNGYIDGTYVDGWAYFLNLSKEINDRQRLLFTVLGGPEKHGQRNLKMSQDEIERFGSRYNKEWGSYNEKINNASENFYHKPHLSLTHYLGFSNQSMLATSVYFSPGWGGGKWNDSFNYGPNVFSFRNPSGQIDWDSIYDYNASNDDSFTLENGQTVSGFSKVVQTHFLASHIWSGALSSFETYINPSTKIIGGIHYRYFKSNLKQEVADLLGGQFYIDDFSWSAAGIAGRKQIKMPGDVIRIHNGALLHNSSVFAQIEKTKGRSRFFSAVTISDSRFRRHDVYNYPTNKWSEWVNKPGFDVKAGFNYNLDRYSSFYINAAYFSKAPYYKYVFGNFSNTPVRNIRNEKVSTIEGGYSLKEVKNTVIFSAYYTFWQDVSFLSNEYIQLENNQQTRAMVNGLDALHKGIELEWMHEFYPELKVGGIVSYGDWKWQNDVEARLFNDKDIVVDTVNVYASGLYVGGQPQFQAGLMIQTIVLQKADMRLQFNYYDRHFASFDPSGRQNPEDRKQSFKLPSFMLADFHVSFPIQMFAKEAILYMNINNLFNETYILKGEDGIEHNIETFRGFWSFGRTFDFGFRIKF
jgi:iron complex outermembrane recepter protein